MIAPLLVLLVAPPRVAIVELPPRELEKASPAFLANPLAQALEARGMVAPVVLAFSDPVYRELANSGKFATPERWDRKSALRAAALLKADYLLEVRAARYGDLLRADAELLRAGRVVWKDVQRLSTMTGDKPDDAAAALNAVRNWIPALESGPFRGLTPVTVTPVAPDPIPASVQPAVTPDPGPAPDDDEALDREINRWIAENKLGRAVQTARDGVDARPLSPSRRKTLIRLLARAGEHENAANEARRAAKLLPDRPAFLVDAAREWMLLGRLDEAKADLNEALARGVGGEAHALVAELELRRGRPEVALRSAEEAMRSGPSPEALFSRALARALLGGAEGVREDLKTLAGLKVEDAVRDGRYGRAAAILDPAARRLGDETRVLISRAGAKREDAAVRDLLDDLDRRIASRIVLLEGLVAPASLAERGAKRLLGHRLLAQTVEEIRGWVVDGDRDALRDSSIDLGEAIRALREAATEPPPPVKETAEGSGR